MKKLNKILLLTIFALCTMLATTFSVAIKNIKNSTNAAESTIPSYFSFLNYVSLSEPGHALSTEKLRILDDVAYVVSNKSVTITLKSFNYEYNFPQSEELENFEPNIEIIKVYKDKTLDAYPTTFEYNGIFYSYSISSVVNTANNTEKRILTISDTVNKTSVQSTDSAVVEFSENNSDENGEYIEIRVITDYTSKAKIPGNYSFSFTISNNVNIFSVNFLKPVVNFANMANPIVSFNTHLTDDNGDPWPPQSTIQKELIYNKLTLEFLNNNYTEQNPLFMRINYNGFIYNFELFSKVYNDENLLFVNYVDENNSENSEYLATILDTRKIPAEVEGEKPTIEYIVDELHKVPASISGEVNNFSFIFNKTGRYEIELYDSTYLCEASNPNYYITSFYIREEGESVNPFKNIYIVAQTLDDEQNPLEYIVEASTQNNDIQINIKNLDSLGKDSDGNLVELASILDYIEIKKTIFGVGENHTETEIYTPDKILKYLEDNDTSDFIQLFNIDGFYQITIYPVDKNEDVIYYKCTIIKHPKTNLTVDGVDYAADVPFMTKRVDYEKYIDSYIELSRKIDSKSSEGEFPLEPIKKSYINTYTVYYGMTEVKIEEYQRVFAEGETAVDSLDLRFYGVGDLTVYVTFKGKTTEYILNHEQGNDTLNFTEYGTYTVKLIGSMSSEGITQTFSFEKKLNTSAMALIILSALLIAIILVFVIRARGRVATR